MLYVQQLLFQMTELSLQLFNGNAVMTDTMNRISILESSNCDKGIALFLKETCALEYL